MPSRFIPTGDARDSQFPCVVCGEMIQGAGAEYVKVEVVDDNGNTRFVTREPVRRHFLNDTHSVTLLTIDHKPTAFVRGF